MQLILIDSFRENQTEDFTETMVTFPWYSTCFTFFIVETFRINGWIPFGCDDLLPFTLSVCFLPFSYKDFSFRYILCWVSQEFCKNFYSSVANMNAENFFFFSYGLRLSEQSFFNWVVYWPGFLPLVCLKRDFILIIMPFMYSSLKSFWPALCISQNHRLAEFERDFWRLSCPTSRVEYSRLFNEQFAECQWVLDFPRMETLLPLCSSLVFLWCRNRISCILISVHCLFFCSVASTEKGLVHSSLLPPVRISYALIRLLWAFSPWTGSPSLIFLS